MGGRTPLFNPLRRSHPAAPMGDSGKFKCTWTFANKRCTRTFAKKYAPELLLSTVRIYLHKIRASGSLFNNKVWSIFWIS